MINRDLESQPAADNEVVQGDYFAALGINLIRGRTFNEHDTATSPKVVIIDQTLADTTFKGVHPELEEAGRILGAGRLRVLGEITAPLAKSGIIATWCFIFIGVIRELSASIILFTPNTKVMSVVIFDLKEEGQFGAIAVLGLFMLAMTFAIVALMQGLLGRDVLGSRPSSGAQG